MTFLELAGIATMVLVVLIGGLTLLPGVGASIVDRIAAVSVAVLRVFSRGLKQSAADYVDVESTHGPQTFLLKDGSRMTVCRIRGVDQIIGADEFDRMDRVVNERMKAFLGNGAHEFVFTHEEDPEGAERVIREAQRAQRETAARLELNLDDLFEEDVVRLSKYCSRETTLMCLYTLPKVLGPEDWERDKALRAELLAGHKLPKVSIGPNVLRSVREMAIRHDGFVDSFVRECRTAGFRIDVLGVGEASREMRMAIDPEFTSSEYCPALPFEGAPQLRMGRRDPSDASGSLPPALDIQLIPRDVVREGRTVRVGDRRYAPMEMFLAQKTDRTKPFSAMVASAKSAGVPWRIAIRVGPEGIKTQSLKTLFNGFIQFSNPENKIIREANEAIRELSLRGATDVRLQMDFVTWAPAHDERLLSERASKLARAIEAWGGIEVRLFTGDAVESLMAASPGLSRKSPANITCGLLDDVAALLPLYRPAELWSDGAVLFRTVDGKLYPFQPHSNIQSNYVNVFIAEPRAGKSVLANAINTALCLSPGLTRLPLIGIIDVGRSSAGFISLIKNALPASKQHLVQTFRLRMEAGYEINPFDTSLGCDNPLPQEAAFAENFLLTAISPNPSDAVEELMVNFTRDVVRSAYTRFNRHGQFQKIYCRGLDGMQDVDAALNTIGFDTDDGTTYWEVVDALIAAGRFHDASLAQRHAVPQFSDLTAVSSENYFGTMYSDASLKSGEGVIKAFQRLVNTAIQNYPILAKATRFDVGEARIVSIDLDEVAKEGSISARHMTAVSYMLARHVVARNFYVHEDDLADIPANVRAYHQRRIADIRQDKKHFMADELHRTRGHQHVHAQFERDAREGGKAGVMSSFISQDISDFPKELLAFSTSRFILSTATNAASAMMSDYFNATGSVLWAAQNRIRAPGPEGSTVLALFRTRDGGGNNASQVLKLTLGGIRLWAQSTTNEDAYVRDALYARMGAVETRRLLAKEYPSGSLLPEVERRRALLLGADAIDEKAKQSIIDTLVEELYAYSQRQRGRQESADHPKRAA